MKTTRTNMPEPFLSNPEVIYKHRLLEFLTELQQSHSLIYKLLRRLPKSVLWIVADDDFRNSLFMLSVQEFLDTHEQFYPRLARFTVRFNTYLLRKEWDACGAAWKKYEIFCGVEQYECEVLDDLPEIIEAFECILIYFLRESMQKLRPFRADEDTCREYGLTETESAELRELVEYANGELRNEFRCDMLHLNRIVWTFDQKEQEEDV